MEVVEVRVDDTFLSLNEVIRKTKGNWKSYHRLSKQQQNRILVACLQQKPGKVTEPVLVEFSDAPSVGRADQAIVHERAATSGPPDDFANSVALLIRLAAS